MNNSIIRFLSISLLVCVFATTPAPGQETVKIAIGEWRPYFSRELKHYGLVSKIITEAFLLENIKVKYGFFPWKRSLELAKKGKGWGGSGIWSKTKDREPFFLFSDPVMVKQIVFFHLKTTELNWEKLSDLKDYKIGGTIGYKYHPPFERAERKGILNIERVRSDDMNFKKLLKGRISLFICDFTIGYATLNKLFDRDTTALFTNNPRSVVKSYNSLILSKKLPGSRELMKRFNMGLKKLRASGRYDQYILESRQGKYKIKDSN